MVLGAVGQAVEQEIDAEEQQSPSGTRLFRTQRLLVLLSRVQREDGNASCHRRNDEVLVEGISLAEDGDVEEHDREEFAALCEEEGDVVDVREAGVSERTGEATRDRDEGKGPENTARGDDGRNGRA